METLQQAFVQKVILLLVVAFTTAATEAIAQEAASDQAVEETNELLVSIVKQQQADWNAGNIDGFMKAYWKSDKLTFCSGGKTQRGWIATRDRYRKSYPSKEAMGKLTFSELEMQMLGSETALMLGRWKLEKSEPAGGNFSLVWKRMESGWKIVHDHTSLDAEKEEPDE